MNLNRHYTEIIGIRENTEQLQEDIRCLQAVIENPDVKFTPTLGINFGVSITNSSKYFIQDLHRSNSISIQSWGHELERYFQTIEKNGFVKIDQFSNGLKKLEQKLAKFPKIQDPRTIPNELLKIVEDILGHFTANGIYGIFRFNCS